MRGAFLLSLQRSGTSPRPGAPGLQSGHKCFGATTLLMCLLAGLVCVALPGCSGCQEDPAAKAKREAEEELEAKRKQAEEAKKKKKEEPKEEFTVGSLLVEPNENTAGGAVKPGHWIGVSQLMQANKADFNGDVATIKDKLLVLNGAVFLYLAVECFTQSVIDALLDLSCGRSGWAAIGFHDSCSKKKSPDAMAGAVMVT